jgi:hypothetical protein
MAQTTIQKTAAVRKGSVVVKVGDSFASLVDIGALRKPVFTSLIENQEIKFDNVTDLKKFVNGLKVQFSFDLAEINLTNIASMDAGWATLATVAASPVAVTGEALGTGWTQGTPIKLANKNGANTIVASITIKENGVSLVLNTDYRTYVGNGTNGELGATYIVPVSARTLAITADYTYTPNTAKKLTFATSGTKTLKVIRVENTDENGKIFRIDIQNVTNLKAPAITFAGDVEADVAILPIEMVGEIVEIRDEQQTT